LMSFVHQGKELTNLNRFHCNIPYFQCLYGRRNQILCSQSGPNRHLYDYRPLRQDIERVSSLQANGIRRKSRLEKRNNFLL
ncbi:MAG: hypothetical protein QME81_10905, partial [bacterium]|nr:hypothetical protein [bacterium]